MKRILLRTLFTFLSLTCIAQDIIVKKDGSIIQAKVAKIGTTEVEYKKWSNQDGPVYTIAKSEILAITYQNGEKEAFSTQSNSLQKNEVVNEPKQIEFTPDENNSTLIESYNIYYVPTKELQKKYKQKTSTCTVENVGLTRKLEGNSLIFYPEA